MPAPKGNQYAKGNKGGAPTKYSPKFCEAIIRFFKQQPYSVLKDYRGRTVLNKYGQPALVPVDFPTIEGFAATIGVAKKTMLEWVEKYKEFGNAYTRAKDLQKHILVVNGLNGNYNPRFAQFVATNATDMIEKSTVEHTGSIDITDEQYARIIAREASSLEESGE